MQYNGLVCRCDCLDSGHKVLQRYITHDDLLGSSIVEILQYIAVDVITSMVITFILLLLDTIVAFLLVQMHNSPLKQINLKDVKLDRVTGEGGCGRVWKGKAQ